MRPEKIDIKCPHCGYQWLQPTAAIVAIKAVIFRGGEESVTRRLKCPNCNKDVKVTVLKEWTEHE